MNNWILWISFGEILIGIFGLIVGVATYLINQEKQISIILFFIIPLIAAIPITLGFKNIIEELRNTESS